MEVSNNNPTNNSTNSNNQNTIKKWLWVPCPIETFKPAYILNESLDSITVQSNIIETFKPSQVFKMNPSNFDKTMDLSLLSHLNEPSVLYNLKKRYDDSLIYTYSGLFLISLNPYKSLNIYNDNIKKEITLNNDYPHIFSIANKAYKDMLSNKESQSILITGESGAGKTENTKRVIEFITYISNNNSNNSFDSLLYHANPILEAFGNAKTIKNDNSSRFGKFIQMKFKGGQLYGARIEKYLLEKSRITHQNHNERSYHIFYYLLKGASELMIKKLKLTRNPSDFNCIKNSCYEIKGIDDSYEFKRLEESFNNLNIESEWYYIRLAAILHLSNIEFTESNSSNSNIGNNSNSNNSNNSGDSVFIKDLSPVESACNLLNIPITDFIKNILYPTISAGSEILTHYRTIEECKKVLEGFMRSIYESLFDNLIFNINSILDCNNEDGLFIGVLDIAGFEIFKNNSFEQLCINYTNEKLQQFFNHHMFILEQEIYHKENIDWNFIDFGLDLEPTIKIIESNNPIGILSYLDEECLMPRSNDDTLLNKIGSINGIEKIPFKRGFRLKHYAGKVEYEVEGWIEKNNDHSDKYLFSIDLLTNSNNNGSVKKGIFRTVAQSHRENLKRLMELLKSTNPHFVRCILPNLNKSNDEFDKKLILEQLKCNGVLEGIRISRLGYPGRIRYEEFVRKYLIILSGKEGVSMNRDSRSMNRDSGSMNRDSGSQREGMPGTEGVPGMPDIESMNDIESNPLISKDLSKNILNSIPSLNSNDYKFGNSMLFFKQGILADIEDLKFKIILNLSKKIRNILKSKFQSYLLNINSIRNNSILILQSNSRNSIEFLKWKWWSLFIKIKPLLEIKNINNIDYEKLLEKEKDEKLKICEKLKMSENFYEEIKKSEELLKLAIEEKNSLLEGLRNERMKINEENINLKGIIENLHERLHEKLKKDLTTEENNLTKLSHLEKELFDSNARLSDSNARLSDSNAKLSELEKLNSSLKETVKRIKEENSDLSFNLEKINSEILKKECLLNEKISILENLEKNNKNLIKNLEQSEKNLKIFKEENKILIKNLEELKNENNSILEKFYSKKEEKDLNEEKNEKEIKNLIKKLEDLENLHNFLIEERNSLFDENQKLTKEKIEFLYNSEIRENKEKKALQFEIQKLKNENEKLKNENNSSNDEINFNLIIEEERAIRRRLEKRVNELETINLILESKSKDDCLFEKHNKQQDQQNQLTKEINDLKIKINTIKKGIKSTMDLFENEYFSLIKKNEESIQNLIIENNELNKKNLIFDKNEKEIKKIKKENQIFKNELEETIKKNGMLKNELDSIKILLESDKILIKEKEEEILKIRKEEEVLRIRLEGVVKEYNERINKMREGFKEDLLVYRSVFGTEIGFETGTEAGFETGTETGFEIGSEGFNGRSNEVVVGCMNDTSCVNDDTSCVNNTSCVDSNKDLCRNSNKNINVKMNRLSILVNPLLSPLNNKINQLNNELINLSNLIIQKDLEISILKSNIENSSILISNQPVSILEVEKIIPIQIIDKELLKNMERKKILNCNCNFMNKIKIIETVRENNEEMIKINNEKSLLELKLKQCERKIEEQEKMIEGMRNLVIKKI